MVTLLFWLGVICFFIGLICFYVIDTDEIHIWLIVIGIIAMLIGATIFIICKFSSVDEQVRLQDKYDNLVLEIKNTDSIDEELYKRINDYNYVVKVGIARANSWVYSGQSYGFYNDLAIIEIEKFNKPIEFDKSLEESENTNTDTDVENQEDIDNLNITD